MKKPRLTCCKCPKWGANWCPFRAEACVPAHPMCDIGHKLYTKAYSAAWMRQKHGFKMRVPKAVPTNETTNT